MAINYAGQRQETVAGTARTQRNGPSSASPGEPRSPRSPRPRRINHTLPPTSDDLELVGHIRNLYYRARSERRPKITQWNRNYRVSRLRTWSGPRPAWLPSPEVPEIYPILASLVGWTTDQRPTWEVGPAAQTHSPYHDFMAELSNDLSSIMKSNWIINRHEAEIEKCVWDGLTYGIGILKTTWDDAADKGMGAPVRRRVDPYSFYPDPAATSHLDANYFIEARTMSLQELDRRWPNSARLFPTGGVSEDVDKEPSSIDVSSPQRPRANPGAISPATSPRYGLPGQSRLDAPVEDQGVTVFEAWLREHSIEEVKGELVVQEWWRVVVVAGSQVLMDEPADELWSHGRHPYSFFRPHETGEFWGQSLVELLAPAQLALNRILASIQHNIELVGNPVFKEGAASGLQRTRITNRPGVRVTVRDNAQADWMQPPQLHPWMAEMLNFLIREMERVSGLSAITRGMMPGGRNAATVLDSVQEASFVRVRLMLRNLEWALRDSGELEAALTVEYFTEPRVKAIVGDDGTLSALALKSKHFYVPTGRIDGPRSLPMKYSLLVDVGAAAATSRQRRFQEAKELYALGVLDEEAVLEAADWPNRRRVIERVQQKKEAGLLEPPGARQRSQRAA